DLLAVSQWIEQQVGLQGLYDLLLGVFEASWAPTPLHRLLARIAAIKPGDQLIEGRKPAPLLVVTTNYDDLLERALDAQRIPYDVVWYWFAGEDRPEASCVHRTPDKVLHEVHDGKAYTGLAILERPVVLKIHGNFHRPRTGETSDSAADLARWNSFVITEDDYIDYIARADFEELVPASVWARIG